MLGGLQLLWLQLQLAANITKIMNTSMDPCVDFYEYSCGNYKNYAKISDDSAIVKRFTETEDELRVDLKTLFEEPAKPDDPRSAQTVKTFYRSCINETQLEKIGLNPLKNFLLKYGGWPVVDGDAWSGAAYDWIRMSARLTTEIKAGDIIYASSAIDLKNSSRKYMKLDQPTLVLDSRDFYVKPSNKGVLDAYFEYMVESAVQLGANESAARKELQKSLELEIELANISDSDSERADKNTLYNPTTVAKLKTTYPKLKTVGEAGWHLGDEDVVNVYSTKFFEKLPQTLEKYSARKDECIEQTRTTMIHEVGAMYATRYFGEDAKKDVDDMVTNIRNAMASTVDTLEWMDSKTKGIAHKKITNMIQQIAYLSPDIYNDTWVRRSHLKSQVSDDTYLANILSLRQSERNKMIEDYRLPVNRTEWTGKVAYFGAWYTRETNKMNFPAGILRGPWYYPYAPDYYNYGHIGMAMGHELTHGFDDEGRQYDENGNSNLWWSNDTLEKFYEESECFIEQYNSVNDYTTGRHLSGENTLGENIADNGGVVLAYKALKAARERDKNVALDDRNKILPSLEIFTIDQLYFISFAQAWCAITRREFMVTQIVADEHSPDRYRVTEPLKNNGDFAAAFKCQVEDPMNPKQKCKIW